MLSHVIACDKTKNLAFAKHGKYGTITNKVNKSHRKESICFMWLYGKVVYEYEFKQKI